MVNWKIEFERDAENDLNKFDYLEAREVRAYLYREIATRMDPQSVGRRADEFWRYEASGVRVYVRIEPVGWVIRVARVIRVTRKARN
jgi:mRNA-degrading endonuclease RelE of RelBE toxin-antitoxin system